MKYVIFLGDGMADLPVPELDGKTPLMAAAGKGNLVIVKALLEAGADINQVVKELNTVKHYCHLLVKCTEPGSPHFHRAGPAPLRHPVPDARSAGYRSCAKRAVV